MSLQFVHSHDSANSHSDTVWGAKWLPNDTVLSISVDGSIVHWNASTGEPLKSLPPHSLALTSLSSNARGSHALFNSIEGTTFLWDLESYEVVGKEESLSQVAEGVDAAWSTSLSPSGDTYISTGASGLLRVHSAAPGEEFGKTLDTISPRADKKNKFGMFITYSPDGARAALSTDQGAVYVFDLEKKVLAQSFSSHATCVRSLAWSADSSLLLSASDDRRLVLHDTRLASASSDPSTSANSSTGVVASFSGHASWVLSVDISPDGKLAASGSSDTTVKIWDIASRQCVTNLTADQGAGEVWGVSWKPTSSGSSAGSLVTTSEDGRLRWWRSAGA